MWGSGFGWGRGGFGPWSGRGPFSYLPPWQRPGWRFGGRPCWWLYRSYPPSIQYQTYVETSPMEEVKALEAYKKDLEEELKGIEARIKELRESPTEKRD